MEAETNRFIPKTNTVVVERPDGTTFHQSIANDFYALLNYKKELGDGYWIVDIY